MQNVSIADGGNAIVGNVTQHASVIVKDKGSVAVRKAPKAVGSGRRRDCADAKREAQA